MMLNYLVLTMTAYVAALILTPLVRKSALRFGVVDRPGKRKMHLVPMPRLGGVGLALAIVVAILAALAGQHFVPEVISLSVGPWLPIMLGGLIVFMTGVWDDIRPLPPSVKVFFESGAAGVAIWFMGPIREISIMGGQTINLGIFALPLTLLWIVGITNAFNLIDGLDGLAAGLASIAAGTSAAIFFLHGDAQDAMLMMLLLGGLLGFLHYNFNPAQIFLGDSGSLLVGYILAVTAMSGSQRGATALAVVIPLLIFGLPIFDTLLCLVRRFIVGLAIARADENSMKTKVHAAKFIFQPDAHHIHHRLLAIGFPHRRAVLLLYAIALWLSFMALLSVMAQYRNAGMILAVVGLATYIGLRKLGYEEIAFLKAGTLLRWYEQLAFNRMFFLGFLDMILIGLSYWGAVVLKYDSTWTVATKAWHLAAFPVVLGIQFFAFYVCGLYRGVWRAANVADVMRIVLAVASGGALAQIICQLSIPPEGNLTFFCIDVLLLGSLVTCSRNIYSILEYTKALTFHHHRVGIIYGAGRNGQLLLRAFSQDPALRIRPIGFLDDDPSLQGRLINNIPVLGSCKDLASILEANPFTTLIISSDKIMDEQLKQVIRLCTQRHVPVLKAQLQLEAIDNVSFDLSSSTRAEAKTRHQAA